MRRDPLQVSVLAARVRGDQARTLHVFTCPCFRLLVGFLQTGPGDR